MVCLYYLEHRPFLVEGRYVENGFIMNNISLLLVCVPELIAADVFIVVVGLSACPLACCAFA